MGKAHREQVRDALRGGDGDRRAGGLHPLGPPEPREGPPKSQRRWGQRAKLGGERVQVGGRARMGEACVWVICRWVALASGRKMTTYGRRYSVTQSSDWIERLSFYSTNERLLWVRSYTITKDTRMSSKGRLGLGRLGTALVDPRQPHPGA